MSDHQCIRCDKPAAEEYPDSGDFQLLTFKQETAALPICGECFEEVKGRDLWG